MFDSGYFCAPYIPLDGDLDPNSCNEEIIEEKAEEKKRYLDDDWGIGAIFP